MFRESFCQALFGEWIVKGFLHDRTSLIQSGQQAGLLQRVVADHVLAGVEFDEKTLQRLLRRATRALGSFLLKDEALDRVHLVTGTTSAFEQVLHGLAHFLGTETVWIERTLPQQIKAERTKRGGKVLELCRPVFREFAQQTQ